MRSMAIRFALVAITSILAAGTARAGSGYFQTNLVSNQSGVAQVTDPNLINPWGISFSTGSPFWVSNQGVGNQPTATTTVYRVPAASGGLTVNPNHTALTVGIPNVGGAAPSDNNGPTGQVNTSAPGIVTGSSDFLLNGSKAAFIFANLDGSILAWNGGGTATIIPSTVTAGASYTGLAIGNSGGNAFLYAADQNSTNVNIFNSQWQMVGHLATDPNLPSGFTAFNVQNIGGILYVTYANPNNPLGGVVDEYRTDGTLIKTLISDAAGTHLQTPWGLALAPGGFGAFGGDLLIGNNDGDGWINAYTPGGTWVGQLMLHDGTTFSQGELWGLTFGNGGSAGSKDILYFAAGLPGATNGLFGALSVPEPSSAVLGLIAVGALASGWSWKNRRRATKP
jgi:uncharacterized protein (TIGR03118 family)